VFSAGARLLREHKPGCGGSGVAKTPRRVRDG